MKHKIIAPRIEKPKFKHFIKKAEPSAKENLIHIKFEYGEMLEAKRDILETQASLIKIIQIAKAYNSLRQSELKQKIKLAYRFKDIRNEIKKLEEELPKLQIPNILKEKSENLEIKELVKNKLNPIRNRDNLQAELEDIQNKLKALER